MISVHLFLHILHYNCIFNYNNTQRIHLIPSPEAKLKKSLINLSYHGLCLLFTSRFLYSNFP